MSVQLVSKISNLCDHNPPTVQTDRQTDRRHAIPRPRICTKVHCAVKPLEAKAVPTRGTDSRLVFAERRTCGGVVIQKGVKVSGLSGAESVMGKRGKLEL